MFIRALKVSLDGLSRVGCQGAFYPQGSLKPLGAYAVLLYGMFVLSVCPLWCR